jgi:hypothetical protein
MIHRHGPYVFMVFNEPRQTGNLVDPSVYELHRVAAMTFPLRM